MLELISLIQLIHLSRPLCSNHNFLPSGYKTFSVKAATGKSVRVTFWADCADLREKDRTKFITEKYSNLYHLNTFDKDCKYDSIS